MASLLKKGVRCAPKNREWAEKSEALRCSVMFSFSIFAPFWKTKQSTAELTAEFRLRGPEEFRKKHTQRSTVVLWGFCPPQKREKISHKTSKNNEESMLPYGICLFYLILFKNWGTDSWTWRWLHSVCTIVAKTILICRVTMFVGDIHSSKLRSTARWTIPTCAWISPLTWPKKSGFQRWLWLPGPSTACNFHCFQRWSWPLRSKLWMSCWNWATAGFNWKNAMPTGVIFCPEHHGRIWCFSGPFLKLLPVFPTLRGVDLNPTQALRLLEASVKAVKAWRGFNSG